MKKLFFTSLVCLFSGGSLWAQVQVLDEGFSPTGVSNEGIMVGYYEQMSPYYLWNPATGEQKEIGGVSAGNGVGGSATFSADGKYLSGSVYHEIPISTDWEKLVITERDYMFTGFGFPVESSGFAIGKNPEDATKGVMLQTSNGGITWSDVNYLNIKGGLEAICFLNSEVGLTGGGNGYFAFTTSRGQQWKEMTPRPAGDTENVTYRTIDFIREEPYTGVVGAQVGENGYAVYQSPDGGESWTEATGVLGIPNDITHVGNTFYLVTQGGQIQKSADNGLTWSKVFQTGAPMQPTSPLFKIRFANDKVGLAASEYCVVYRTTDGGNTWTATGVGSEDGIPQKTSWKDILWQDAQHVTIVGTGGLVYTSSDAGATWTKTDIGADATTDLNAIVLNSDKTYNVCGSHGNFFRKSLIDKAKVAGMGRYDVAAGEWTPLGSLGVIADGISVSSGYAISGDGKTVVGLASTYNKDRTINNGRYAHAVAWTEGKGLTDLGSIYGDINRSTRANAVNQDGSVIVGWQDQRGPWHSAVWRRDGSGVYAPNEFILVDPEAGSDDSSNRVPQCFSVSQDGKWIGGSGKSIASGPLSVIDDDQLIANQPWLWSQETGLKRLGMIEELAGNDGAVGYTSGINSDGTVAVGFIIVGNYMYPFIWTATGGIENLNTYVRNTLKSDLSDEYQICSITSMSPDGRYLAGWGIANNESLFALTVDLQGGTGIESVRNGEYPVRVYPNPVSDNLHIDLPGDAVATARLLDAQGRIVLEQTMASAQNSLSLYGITEGFYLLDVTANGMHQTFKVEINR